LQPLDAFSGLVHPECVCGPGSTPSPAGGAYRAPSDPLACCCLTLNLFPTLGLRPEISRFPSP